MSIAHLASWPIPSSLRDEHGCSILLIEHDMPLLMSVCDRVYALESGRVIAEGDPETVRHDPEVIAGYLGTGAGVGRSGPIVTAPAAVEAPARNGNGNGRRTRARRKEASR